MASALALQCSPSWAMKTHILEAGQFIEFINPWKEWNTEWNDVNCGNTNEMSMWPSQWIAIYAIAKIARKKDFRGFNGIRTRGLCVSAAVLSQLSYEDPYTGGWPIYWVHQPVKGMKHWMKWCELREYKWNEYVTIAVNRNLSNCENSPKKRFSGLQRDSNPWPLR